MFISIKMDCKPRAFFRLKSSQHLILELSSHSALWVGHKSICSIATEMRAFFYWSKLILKAIISYWVCTSISIIICQTHNDWKNTMFACPMAISFNGNFVTSCYRIYMHMSAYDLRFMCVDSSHVHDYIVCSHSDSFMTNCKH